MTAPQAGPPTGKPIQIQLSSDYPDALDGGGASRSPRNSPSARRSATSTTACRCPASTGGCEIDKAEAAKYGIGVGAVGPVVQLVTNGAEDHRLPAGRTPTSRSTSSCACREDRRTLDQIDDLQVQTPAGLGADRQLHQARAGAARRAHPSRRRPARRHGDRQRRRRASTPSAVQQRITERARQDRLQGPGQLEAARARTRSRPRRRPFLVSAFGAAIFLIFAVLLAQFNKLSSVGAGAVGDRAVDDRRVHRPDRHAPGASAS